MTPIIELNDEPFLQLRWWWLLVPQLVAALSQQNFGTREGFEPKLRNQLGVLAWPRAQSSFYIEDFESSHILSLIGEDTIISQIGPPSLAQSNDSKSSM